MGNRGVLFDSRIGDRNFVLPLINNYSATTNPGPTNDSSQGYTRGAECLNMSTLQPFTCVDDTVGAAIWIADAGAPQGAAANHNAAVTLTVAEMQAGLITGTPVAAIAFTTPTGTAMDSGVTGPYVGQSIQFSIIDLGTSGNTITLTAGASGVTIVGNAVVTGGTTGTFKAVRTAAATWSFYRIA